MTHTAEVERMIPFPVEQVYALWLDAGSFAEWFLPDPNVKLGRVELDPRVGGSFLIEMHVGPNLLPHTGTYRTIVPNQALAFTWSSAATEGRETLVEVTFETRAAGTLLKLRHTELPDMNSRDAHHAGWASIVAGTEQFLSSHRGRS
jgi:uncharacterized protein YndB with AHSA1/START domain